MRTTVSTGDDLVIRRGTKFALLVFVALQLGFAGQAHAFGDGARVHIAQLRYSGGNFSPRPTALRRLAWEVAKRTSINMAVDAKVVGPLDQQLFSYPILYVGGDQAFDPLADGAIARLRQYLAFGGMIWVDSSDSRSTGGFDQSIQRMIGRLFPKKKMGAVADNHSLFKSFYLLERMVGRVATEPDVLALDLNGRLALIYEKSDLAGAWSRDNFGRWEFDVHPGGARQRELAFRWGVNFVMYALCLDYKSDQVHIPFILKRRRWQVR